MNTIKYINELIEIYHYDINKIIDIILTNSIILDIGDLTLGVFKKKVNNNEYQFSICRLIIDDNCIFKFRDEIIEMSKEEFLEQISKFFKYIQILEKFDCKITNKDFIIFEKFRIDVNKNEIEFSQSVDIDELKKIFDLIN